MDGGVYWQALGPRLETPAEIRHIARDADVIGMTIGSECVVAAELGLAYAAICAVVNYANGVGDEELTLTSCARASAPPASGSRPSARRGTPGPGLMALAVTNARLGGEIVGLRCEDGRISEVGTGVAARDGDEVIDATGLALVPGW